MYELTLALHNLLRWVVVLTAVLAIARALGGWFGRRPWTPSDDAAGRWFVIAMDAQLLVGLALYLALSPITQNAFGNMGAAVKDTVGRFWAVEHVTAMVLALAAAHIGRARVRRRPTDDAKHRTAAILFTIAFAVLLAGIPWPFSRVPRPWFPGL